MRARGPWAACGALALVLVARPAAAFVCSQVTDANDTPVGASLAWKTRSVPVSFTSQGTVQLDPQDTNTALRASLAVWEQVTLRSNETCAVSPTDMRLPVAPTLTDQDFAGYNYLVPGSNENVMMFRDTGWMHAMLGMDAIAVATTTYNAQTGEIFDADVEFNSQHYTFTVGDTNIATDLQNTAVHEIGHMLGFAHSFDALASMYGNAGTAQTLKRQLGCDDANLINMRYPVGQPTGYCTGTPDAACGMCAPATPLTSTPSVQLVGTNDGLGGCRAGGGSAALPLLAVGMAALRRRRRAFAARSR